MYEQPIQPVAHPQAPSKAPSIISLIVGILALLFGIITFVSVPLGIAAIILGILGIRKKVGKGLAVGGIVTGGIGLVTGLLIAPLLVFIALPSLQKNQSDVAAKNAVASAASGVFTYQSNNMGVVPTLDEFQSDEFKQKYMSESDTVLEYTSGENCDGEQSARAFKVSTTLRDGTDYCQGS